MKHHRLVITIVGVAAMLVASQFGGAQAAEEKVTMSPPVTSTASGQPNLRYERMVYLRGDSISEVPKGHIWRVQAIPTSEAALEENSSSNFLSGLSKESQVSIAARAEVRLKSL
mgnify:CR=1 FL=1